MAELGFATLESREGAIEGALAVDSGTYRTEDNRNLGTDHPMTQRYATEDEPKEGRRDKTVNLVMAVGAFVLAVIGGYVGSWQGGNRSGVRDAEWRGEIRSSLAAIQVQVTGMAGTVSKTESELALHEARITKIELQGSTQAQKAIELLTGLQHSMDQHILDEKAKGK